MDDDDLYIYTLAGILKALCFMSDPYNSPNMEADGAIFVNRKGM